MHNFINNPYGFQEPENPLLVGLVFSSPLAVNSNDDVGAVNGTDTGVTYPDTGDFAESADFTAGNTSQINYGDNDVFSFTSEDTENPGEYIDTDFTIDVLFAHDTLPGSDFILGKRDASTNREYQLAYVTGGITLRWRQFDPSTGGTKDISYTLNPIVDTFYRATLTSISGVLKIYIDGVDTGESQTVSGGYVAMENASADFILGKYSASTSNSLTGYEKKLRIWNRGLSPAEVAAIPTLG